MLGALGVGAPSVDTVLAAHRVQPGAPLTGEVRVKAGEYDADIEYVALGLIARVESERTESERIGTMEFLRSEVAGPFRLRKNEDRVIPFQLPTPWEMPVTEIQGRRLNGMALGVRTELAIASAVDKGDLDPLDIVPLDSQEAVLRAFSEMGFRFRSADLEEGYIRNSKQELPFYQEIEFYPPSHYAGGISEIELTFVTTAADLDIVLEADKRADYRGPSRDVYKRFRVSHQDAVKRNWAAEIDKWLGSIAGRPRGYKG
ncbi:sporulation-control protein [Streptosporangium becharense]|uniref:Sporulation-control protein n=1 Tax=Streptosporangium becharense TaxID=1816182 RepID=A0A7W9IKW2_9ACTN|nr:sporulation protein [Streptosporangium becharense]MBB2911563.1 sporulation-control protein [Streptosporangium becharense]MBB5822619.1 sporulation-control protein [Streptosporangium becharense]